MLINAADCSWCLSMLPDLLKPEVQQTSLLLGPYFWSELMTSLSTANEDSTQHDMLSQAGLAKYIKVTKPAGQHAMVAIWISNPDYLTSLLAGLTYLMLQCAQMFLHKAGWTLLATGL